VHAGRRAMRPVLLYSTVEETAVAVTRWANRTGMPRLTARPYNRFDPANTPWFVTASTEWPAYRLAKLELEPGEAGTLRAGFYVEKGLDAGCAIMYPKRPGYIMDETWAWHRILQAMVDGALERAIAGAAERAGLPIRIWLDSGYPAADAEGAGGTILRDSWSYWTFNWSAGRLALSGSINPPHHDVLGSCASLTDLPAALESLPQFGWRWVDLLIGVECQLAPGQGIGPVDSERWDAAELWRRCLSPWRDWLDPATDSWR